MKKLKKSKKATSQDRNHLLRLLVLLDYLTDHTYGSRTDVIQKHLQDCRLHIGNRQLLRDLNLLRKHFHIDCRELKGNRFKWYWSGDRSWEWGNWENDLPVLHSLREADSLHQASGAFFKLIRVLLIVEMMPSEEDDQWISMTTLLKRLQQFLPAVSKRTVQRDIRFIQKHFLILDRTGPAGVPHYQRMDSESWNTNLEPRVPLQVDGRDPLVQSFLYARSPMARVNRGMRQARTPDMARPDARA